MKNTSVSDPERAVDKSNHAKMYQPSQGSHANSYGSLVACARILQYLTVNGYDNSYGRREIVEAFCRDPV